MTHTFTDGFSYKGDTSTHAQGTDLGGGASRASKGQEAPWPQCSKLVAAHSQTAHPSALGAASGARGGEGGGYNYAYISISISAYI